MTANRGVASGATRCWISRAVGLCWQATSACGLGPGSPRRSARSAARSADWSFVPRTASAGMALALVQEGHRIEVLQLVEIRAGEMDSITLFEARCSNRLQVPLLRAEDEDVSHKRNLHRKCYR